MANVDNVCDYILTRLLIDDTKAGGRDSGISHLKLQKLLYYAQAWHLAIFGRPLFSGQFQAWVHGPVHRGIYDRFRDSKMLYSPIMLEDRRDGFDPDVISEEERAHIDEVLEVYGGFTDIELESLTHDEDPWKNARGELPDNQPSTAPIDNDLMGQFYRARIENP